MAQTIYCSSEDGQPAALLVTNLETGETVGICPACLVPWCLTICQEAAPDQLQEAATQLVAGAEASKEGEAAPDPPRPKRRRSAAQSGPAALSAPESPLQDVTPDNR